MSHTPGPWKIDGREIIAGQGAIVVVGNRGLCSDDTVADARLIAAAPDLLAALYKLDANCAENPEWIRMVARAAIAKATGVQQ